MEIPETGQLEDGETLADYLLRNPSTAETMTLRPEENLTRQISPYTECHRLCRWNVAALLLNSGEALGKSVNYNLCQS